METPHSNEIKRLLVDLAIVLSASKLSLTVFLHQQPCILLIRDQLAEFVGYPLKDIAKALPGHAARIFRSCWTDRKEVVRERCW
jgi:sulfur relay (sulfurtransferase) DsrF/TusC family protein